MATIQHREQAVLDDTYTPVKFLLQLLSIITFFSLLALLVLKISLADYGLLFLVLTFFAGAATADFFSGIVHWGLDTWGTIETPVVGDLIRAFRVHHADEKEMTLHGLLRTAGPTGMATIPVEIVTLFFVPVTTIPFTILCAFLTSLAFWTMMTNQIHKWAHLDIAQIPPIPRFFQKIGLILPPEPHHTHHIEPFTQSYCITTGWMNGFMTRTQFFRKLEKVVVKVTGAVPRADDIGIAAATELAQEEGILR